MWLVVESKGLKTNSEFRGTNKIGENNRRSIINKINRIIRSNKKNEYEKGYRRYETAKNNWESENPGKTFPPFTWNEDYQGLIVLI